MLKLPLSLALSAEELRLIGFAFDECWAGLANDYCGASEETIVQARNRLARIILELAKDDQYGAEEITTIAPRIFKELGEVEQPRRGI